MEAWSDWECPRCSLINDPELLFCDACAYNKPADLPQLDDQLPDQLLDHLPTTSPHKRMKFSVDDLVDLISDDDEDMDLKAAIAASALEHMQASGQSQEGRNDTTRECSSCDLTSPAPPSNALLRNLHSERMQRRKAQPGTTPSDALLKNTTLTPTSLIVASLNVWFDEVLVEERIDAMCTAFSTLAPHVIFLQEVTPEMSNLLIMKLTRLGPPDSPVHLPPLCKLCHGSTLARGRHAIQRPRAALGHSPPREPCSEQNKNSSPKSTSPWVFGGDMNLGRKDVVAIPSAVEDAWIARGRPSAHEFTWDTTVNKNLPNINFAAKCRFDRLYSHGLRCDDFTTFGKDPLVNHSKMFPSDHWGVMATYSSSSW
ncbi:hypothetical protein, variant 3 [Aphanomyces invadans]|uniref:RanBP2-type domain-containing protein n=1 Tax=Aphanomyces invadans TaxID=157072 RepID=A0A024UD96_9STRA|nr:hypothetical protein, variant 2 [Aphanomyces invadans]XP_008867832.1 hypothetical protein, variant 3 [Aphanomyces invadans]ETW03602.1 hypothetical protein, variant 2 [Aphanomyces invadans]ETW03603.1 hypothetical protein, variant 3 [Aphanomyces invadans]|eukprot:XP_008867831.1 hypothetical protein, variant 2 [Aphanomyces invadans]